MFHPYLKNGTKVRPIHYLRYGSREGRTIDPSSLEQPFWSQDDYGLLRDSELFDEKWYSARYMSKCQQGASAAVHYLEIGAAALYDPSAQFNTRAYLDNAPDVRARGMNPLVHYLRYGQFEGRSIAKSQDVIETLHRERMESHSVVAESALFDAEWYIDRYPDVPLSGLTPAHHYVAVGADLLRDPGPAFSTAGYATMNADVIAAHVNPLEHYVRNGRSEGRALRIDPDQSRASAIPVHVPKLHAASLRTRADARIVAFYLPQYHPIPQNNEWWGEGFTEWSGVRPALPQFPGHYQPHIPGELGYYDLRDTDVQRSQIDLAKRYGIDSFCFYFYWFDGVTLLEEPLRNWLADPSLDFPFMLCWANENWSRRWDGRENDVLIAQNHSPEDDLAFIQHAAEYLKDPRYSRVDGKPILVVYRPSLLPDIAATASRWRKWCRDHGVGEIYLAYTTSFDRIDPGSIGFDAAIEFAPNNMGTPDVTKQQVTFGSFNGRMYDWEELVSRSHAYTTPDYRLYRGTNPSWDNTPRRGTTAGILAGSSPSKFTRWTANAIRESLRTKQGDDDNFVFVNAWNEWGEGAHLEPDQAYGYAWLESVRIALASSADATAVARDTQVALFIDTRDQPLPPRLPGWLEEAATEGRVWSVVDDFGADAGDSTSLFVQSLNRVHAPYGNGTLALLQLLPQLDAAGFGVVFRVDLRDLDGATELLMGDAGTLIDRFNNESNLGLVRRGGVTLPAILRPYERRIATRLGLEPREVASHVPQTGGSFAARLSALAPAAVLAFDHEDNSPTGTRYVPSLSVVLDSVLEASARAAGTRVDPSMPSSPAVDRPSILIVTHDMHPHGAQRLALALGTGYRDAGFDVDFVALEGGHLHAAFSSVGETHIISAQAHRIRETRRKLAAIAARGTRVAIVNTTVAAELLPLLKAEGFTLVSLVHELPGVLRQMGLERQARYVAEFADVAVFPSDMVRDRFEEFLGGPPLSNAKIRHQGEYLPAGVGPDRQTARGSLGIPADARVVLAVGYGDHRKGIDLFGQVVAQVLSSDPDAQAIWVGHLGNDGAYDECLATVGRARVTERVRFAGLVDASNMRDFYAAADVLVVPSREDPFPSTIVEAMGSELPVIVFDGCCGNEGLLRQGAGLVVPATDAAAMAKEILGLFSDPVRASVLGRIGRKIRDTEFTFNSYLFDLLDLAGSRYPRVSVVVPNYNYARLLPERLSSIEKQTHPIYEIIVLDDASSDFSAEVIERYAADRPLNVRYLPNDENSGSVFRQWLKGVELAKGDFVWIAEADDLADPDFLSSTMVAFADQDVVVSYTQSRAIDSRGNVSMPDYLAYVSDLDDRRWTAPYVVDGIDEITAGLFVKNVIPNVSAVVFRTGALLDALSDGRDEIMALRNAGDWLAYLRVLERGKIAFDPVPRSSHRRHDASVTVSSFTAAQLAEIRTVQDATIRRHRLSPSARAKATEYAQVLYEQFGLASEGSLRVDESSIVGPQAIQELSQLLEPLRIGVVSIPRRLPTTAAASFADLYEAIGRNTGNYMFTEAMFRQLSGRVEHIGFGFNPDRINADFDAVVVPAANWLNQNSDWTFLVDRIEKLRVPVIMIGIGLQADTTDLASVAVHESALRLVRVIADRSESISTRGEFTSEWLRRQGYRAVVTTGCPSTYMRQAAIASGSRGGLILQSTRYGLTSAFADGAGLNERLFKLAARHGIDMLFQSEPEELQALLLPGGHTPPAGFPDGLLAHTYGLKNDDEARAYIMDHGKAFLNLDDWSQWVATKGGQFGTRLHGAILALNSGVPAVLAPHDSRTAEVAKFARIPTFNFDQAAGLGLETIQEAISNADTASYYAARRENQSVYEQFLRANGLLPRTEGFTD